MLDNARRAMVAALPEMEAEQALWIFMAISMLDEAKSARSLDEIEAIIDASLVELEGLKS